MSTTTLRLEGPDLGALLEEVRTRFGEQANIVAANRCRSGGLGGFFAKETFEVFVEPHRGVEAISRPPHMATNDHRDALDQMIRAADLADGLAESLRPAGRGPTIEARASSRATQPHPAQATSPFSNVLDDAVSRLDSALGEASSGAALLGSNAASRQGLVGPERTTRRQRRAAKRQARKDANDAPQPRRRRRGRRKGDYIDLVRLETGDEIAAMRSPERVPAKQHAPAAATQTPGALPGLVPSEALRRLGFPAPWLEGADGGLVSLAGVVARIPEPRPLDFVGGSVVAFVGPSELALRTARAVANALRQGVDACMLLSPTTPPPGLRCRHVRSLDDLALERESWTSAREVHLVVVDAGFARADVAWARIALAALAPKTCWGVVEATRKPEDIRDWVAGSGAIEALAVFGITDTLAPATTLASGVPIARLDGKPATHDAWRKLVEDRLATLARHSFSELAVP